MRWTLVEFSKLLTRHLCTSANELQGSLQFRSIVGQDVDGHAMLPSNGREGERTVGYDYEPGKGDHRRYAHREEPYTFTTPEQLIRDFLADVRAARRRG